MTDVLPAALIAVLFLLHAFCSTSAYSLRDFSRSKLAEVCRSRKRGRRFGVILKRHDRSLLAVEIVFILATAALVALIFVHWNLSAPQSFNGAGWTFYCAKLLCLAVAGVFTSVVLPWTLSRIVGESFLDRFWPLIQTLDSLARPLTAAIERFDRLAHRVGGVPEPTNGDAQTLTEELNSVLDVGEREGLLESEAHSMIQRVMDLQQEDTAAVMTPRTEMISIPVDASLEEARTQLLDSGHSRVPVVGETTDDIVGILYAKDLLKHMSGATGEPVGLRNIVREPFYVPETTGIDKLLESMKRQRIHIAIVVDEYSGVAGLVTMEDVLEEIVGDIADEYDEAQEDGVHVVSPGVTEVAARVNIDDLNDGFDLDLPEDGDYETVGGFVFNQLGRVPEPGDTFNWGGIQVTVLSADSRSVHRVRIEKLLPVASTAAE